MASHTGASKDPLTFLATHADKLEFFQTLRLINAMLDMPHTTRIKSLPSLAFAQHEVDKIAIDQSDKTQTAITLWQTFIGLTGQNGILPDHFTELLLERLAAKDTTLSSFLDIFNQRIAELLYEAWTRGRFYVDFECDDQAAIKNKLLSLIRSLVGLPQFQQQRGFDDFHIYYSGLLANQVKSAEGLQRILQDHFDVPISINQYSGEWININATETTCLSSQQAHGRNSQLGRNCLLGKRVWHPQNRFQIDIGPLNYQQYYQLLPNGVMLAAVKKITQFYAGYEYRFSTKLHLKSRSVPKCRLNNKRPLQLGWNTWLKTSNQPQQTVAVEFGNMALVNVNTLPRRQTQTQPLNPTMEQPYETFKKPDHQAESNVS